MQKIVDPSECLTGDKKEVRCAHEDELLDDMKGCVCPTNTAREMASNLPDRNQNTQNKDQRHIRALQEDITWIDITVLVM